MKRVFAILHEPASYTVDRNRAIYDKLGIRYCYMHSSSLAKSDDTPVGNALSDLPGKSLCTTLRKILHDNDIIIMNGYTGRVFVLLYILNIYYRKIIGIDSDTQLNVPSNFFKRLLKGIYLTTIFKNKKIFGLPGGTKTHYQLFKHYGMTDDRICLMPMVVNNSRFINQNKPVIKKFRFLYVGRLVSVKNLDIMLDAFNEAFGDRQDVELRVVGQGALFDELILKYSMCPNIIFAGAKFGSNLDEEYKSVSAFILPSSYEPWGLVVNEAMAAGLPVIVSDQVGAAWDLVDGQDTGFIFKYDDTEDLKSKMLTLVNDHELYKTFAQNASHRVNEEWNYDFYRRCLLDFIDKAGKV